MGKNFIKKSVGLVVFTKIPKLGLVAILRERGYFNFEKMKKESWYGVCQVTVHGCLEKNETFLEALKREIKEELGEKFYSFFSRFENSLKKIYHFKNGKREIITFSVKIPYYFLKKIQLSPETGAIRFLKNSELSNVKSTKFFSKTKGVSLREEIVMFPDEKEAIKRGFAFYE